MVSVIVFAKLACHFLKILLRSLLRSLCQIFLRFFLRFYAVLFLPLQV